ncbi:hypothetical protein V1478_013505 [Vespula squamosa]|uniref:Uncharacterized protein n=1 Tax=Vespula squamosa TaxID=30214 RepID=A0ABD2AD92_VESSQ
MYYEQKLNNYSIRYVSFLRLYRIYTLYGATFKIYPNNEIQRTYISSTARFFYYLKSNSSIISN